ncbi:MAG: hypothetical protein KBS56_00190 [Clostridiales bacterium]|nr:hypothetical protein [Candidatus Crickella equi]
MKNRLIALLLTLSMMVTFMPSMAFTSFADDFNGTVPVARNCLFYNGSAQELISNVQAFTELASYSKRNTERTVHYYKVEDATGQTVIDWGYQNSNNAFVKATDIGSYYVYAKLVTLKCVYANHSASWVYQKDNTEPCDGVEVVIHKAPAKIAESINVNEFYVKDKRLQSGDLKIGYANKLVNQITSYVEKETDAYSKSFIDGVTAKVEYHTGGKAGGYTEDFNNVPNTILVENQHAFGYTSKKSGNNYNENAEESIRITYTNNGNSFILYTTAHLADTRENTDISGKDGKGTDGEPIVVKYSNASDREDSYKAALTSAVFLHKLDDTDTKYAGQNITFDVSNLLAVSSLAEGATSDKVDVTATFAGNDEYKSTTKTFKVQLNNPATKYTVNKGTITGSGSVKIDSTELNGETTSVRLNEGDGFTVTATPTTKDGVIYVAKSITVKKNGAEGPIASATNAAGTLANGVLEATVASDDMSANQTCTVDVEFEPVTATLNDSITVDSYNVSQGLWNNIPDKTDKRATTTVNEIVNQITEKSPSAFFNGVTPTVEYLGKSGNDWHTLDYKPDYSHRDQHAFGYNAGYNNPTFRSDASESVRVTYTNDKFPGITWQKTITVTLEDKRTESVIEIKDDKGNIGTEEKPVELSYAEGGKYDSQLAAISTLHVNGEDTAITGTIQYDFKSKVELEDGETNTFEVTALYAGDATYKECSKDFTVKISRPSTKYQLNLGTVVGSGTISVNSTDLGKTPVELSDSKKYVRITKGQTFTVTAKPVEKDGVVYVAKSITVTKNGTPGVTLTTKTYSKGTESDGALTTEAVGGNLEIDENCTISAEFEAVSATIAELVYVSSYDVDLAQREDETQSLIRSDGTPRWSYVEGQITGAATKGDSPFFNPTDLVTEVTYYAGEKITSVLPPRTESQWWPIYHEKPTDAALVDCHRFGFAFGSFNKNKTERVHVKYTNPKFPGVEVVLETTAQLHETRLESDISLKNDPVALTYSETKDYKDQLDKEVVVHKKGDETTLVANATCVYTGADVSMDEDQTKTDEATATFAGDDFYQGCNKPFDVSIHNPATKYQINLGTIEGEGTIKIGDTDLNEIDTHNIRIVEGTSFTITAVPGVSKDGTVYIAKSIKLTKDGASGEGSVIVDSNDFTNKVENLGGTFSKGEYYTVTAVFVPLTVNIDNPIYVNSYDVEKGLWTDKPDTNPAITRGALAASEIINDITYDSSLDAFFKDAETTKVVTYKSIDRIGDDNDDWWNLDHEKPEGVLEVGYHAFGYTATEAGRYNENATEMVKVVYSNETKFPGVKLVLTTTAKLRDKRIDTNLARKNPVELTWYEDRSAVDSKEVFNAIVDLSEGTKTTPLDGFFDKDHFDELTIEYLAYDPLIFDGLAQWKPIDYKYNLLEPLLHTFGDNTDKVGNRLDYEIVNIYYPGDEIYKPFKLENVKVNLVENRTPTEIICEDYTIKYCPEADFKAAALSNMSLIDDEGNPVEYTADQITLNPTMMNASEEPQPVRISYSGNHDYKPYTKVVNVTVDKAKAKLSVADLETYTYDGNAHQPVVNKKFIDPTSNTTIDYITLTGGASTSVQGFLSLDIPESVKNKLKFGSFDIYAYLQTQIGEGKTLDKFEDIIGIINGRLDNLDEATLARMGIEKGAFDNILDAIGDMNLGSGVKVTLGTGPKDAGTYITTAVSVDRNYEFTMDIGSMIILQKGWNREDDISLEFNREMDGTDRDLSAEEIAKTAIEIALEKKLISEKFYKDAQLDKVVKAVKARTLTIDEANRFDWGGYLAGSGILERTEDGKVDPAVQKFVHAMYIGMPADGGVYAEKDVPPTAPGVYSETVYVLLGNYIAMPITRVFKIQKHPGQLNWIKQIGGGEVALTTEEQTLINLANLFGTEELTEYGITKYNQIRSAYVISIDDLENFDFGSYLSKKGSTEIIDEEAVQGHVKRVIAGVDYQGRANIGKPTKAGLYVEISYVLKGEYRADPIIRAFKVERLNSKTTLSCYSSLDKENKNAVQKILETYNFTYGDGYEFETTVEDRETKEGIEVSSDEISTLYITWDDSMNRLDIDGIAKKAMAGEETGAVEEARDAGLYLVLTIFNGNESYKPSYDWAFLRIKKADITPVLSINSWIYGGYDPQYNTPYVSGNLGEGAVTYEYAPIGTANWSTTIPTQVGSYWVRATVAETKNYKGAQVKKSFSIYPREAGAFVINAIDDQLYTGSAITPKLEIVGLNGLMTEGVDYTVTYKNNVEPGYATAIVTFKGNYQGKASIKFRIYGKPAAILLGKATPATGSAAKISWNKIPGASKYVVYGNQCGKTIKKIKTVRGTSLTVKKIAGKKLKAHTTYKFYVVALDASGKTIAKTKTAHFIAAKTKGDHGNVTKISANTATGSVVAGQEIKLGAAIKVYKNMKPLELNHAAKLRFISDNPEVATVSTGGYVTGIRPGTATIYIIAVNGMHTKTVVTVTK